jgi:hypothetical protein
MKAKKITELVEALVEPKGNQVSYKNDPRKFEEAFDKWMKIAKQRVLDNYKQYRNLEPPDLIVEEGNRYWKVVRHESSSRSVFAFIDTQNGNVYKPASWRAPAKHARGNIFDDDNGAKWVTAYGPAYLK